MSAGALDGIRILDLSRILAAPLRESAAGRSARRCHQGRAARARWRRAPVRAAVSRHELFGQDGPLPPPGGLRRHLPGRHRHDERVRCARRAARRRPDEIRPLP